MSNKTNDEKLRILQERLAQIKQKQDTEKAPQKEEVIEVPTPKIEEVSKEKKPLNLKWVRNTVLIAAVAYGGFYMFNNVDWNSLIPQEDVTEETTQSIELKYNFNIAEGNNVAVLTTKNEITDESSAKAFVNDLKVKGFKCNYFFLPENSNSTNEVYQIFIGPYENKEEANQWAKNLDLEFKIINL